MPIYDFHCKRCGKKEFDTLQRMSDPKPKCCGISMEVVPGLCSGYVFPAEGITLTNVEARPKTFHSTKEMRRYAKDKNLELGALL